MLDSNNWLFLVLSALGLTAVCVVAVRRFYLRKIERIRREMKIAADRLMHYEAQSFHDKNELNAILSSMVEGVMVIGADERILYVSPNASQMFQMRSAQVELKPYWEVIPHAQINSSIKEALENKLALNKEIVLIGVSDIFFSMQISPILREGRLKSIVAVFHDITALKKLIAMRSEFVANVSHELKTPLTAIKGFVETLADEGGLDDQINAKRFLEIIHKQTQRLETLVEDLLVLSAIESREAKMDFAPLEVGSVIQSVISVSKKAIDKKEIVLSLTVSCDLPKVLADYNRLEQVFINLLDNAVKFTPAQGKIAIKAYMDAGWVRIDVKDSGVGIPAEFLPRIFERFFRVDKSRTGDTGTGLGLAIVKHIIHAHQGRIDVESAPQQGSTFSISLKPCKD